MLWALFELRFGLQFLLRKWSDETRENKTEQNERWSENEERQNERGFAKRELEWVARSGRRSCRLLGALEGRNITLYAQIHTFFWNIYIPYIYIPVLTVVLHASLFLLFFSFSFAISLSLCACLNKYINIYIHAFADARTFYAPMHDRMGKNEHAAGTFSAK